MSEGVNRAEEREAVRGLIARSGRLLDDEAFDAYVDLFTPEGEYVMKGYSPEIGRETTWLSADREELSRLLEELAEHVRDPATRVHLVSVDEMDLNGEAATAISTFVVVRTDRRGESALYAVGRYEDELVRRDGAWRLDRRTVRVQTRMLPTPTPTPI